MSTALESLCLLITDGTHYTPPNIGEGVPFLTVADMQPSGLNFETCSRISPFEFERADRQNSAPKRGDVLFSKDGTVGKVHVVEGEGPFAVLSSIAIIRPDPKKLDANYLAHFLRSPGAISAAERSKTGSALRRIILKDIKRLSLNPPPLPEQRRIAAILDQAHVLRRLRQQSLSRLSTLGQARFEEEFGTIHGTVQLQDAVEDTLIGLVRGAEQFGNNFAYPYVRMDAITRDGQFVPAVVQKTDVDRGELARYALVDGDLLFNTRNSRDLVGKTTIFRGMTGAVFNNNIMRIRFSPAWDPVFVEAYFRSRAGIRELEKRKSGTTSVWAIYWSKLKSFALPKVEHKKQLEFRRFIEAIWLQEEKITAELARYESLFASLQHRAFRGEL